MSMSSHSSHLSGMSPLGSRAAPPSTAELRRRVHARLAERVDPVRYRHKPLSLLRQEARRLVEQFYDAECPALPKPDRDKLVEDVLAEATGVSPLEELFRDEAVKEVVILTPVQVIVRKGEMWLPTSVRFRDDAQLRAVLARLAETGESLTGGPSPAGGFDVQLANGFRAIAVVPPDVMNVPPMVLLARGDSVPAAAPPAPGSGVQLGARPSGAVPTVGPRSTPPRPGATPPARPAGSDSEVLSRPSGSVPTVPGPSSGGSADPMGRIRQKVTQRIINQLAAAGVYDLSKIPLPELRKIITAFVREQGEWDRIPLDAATEERLALEILAGMNR